MALGKVRQLQQQDRGGKKDLERNDKEKKIKRKNIMSRK